MNEGDVCVLIPTLNEAATIGTVIDGLKSEGLTDILVIDGGSEDETRAIAEEHGARVERQSATGKGQAVREALELTESEYILLIDGDGTYDPSEALRLLEPLLEGDAEHVIGDRFAGLHEGSMSRVNQFGNRLINRAFRYVHGRDYRDILSGYRAFTRDSIERFRLTSTGFGIETELAVECAKQDIPTQIVQISYRPRPDQSEPNLRPFRDGTVILITLYRLAKTNNPLFYFGSLGAISLIFGSIIAIYVAWEWIQFGISHEILALVAGVSMVLGVQLVMFGVLSDMILALHREQIRRLE